MITRSCLCGAELSTAGIPPEAAETLVEQWEQWHTGPRCDPVTAEQAERASRREDPS